MRQPRIGPGPIKKLKTAEQAVRITEGPRIVGETLSEILENPEVAVVQFRLPDLQAILRNAGNIILVPKDDRAGMPILPHGP